MMNSYNAPHREDFDTEEDYQSAMEAYEEYLYWAEERANENRR